MRKNVLQKNALTQQEQQSQHPVLPAQHRPGPMMGPPPGLPTMRRPPIPMGPPSAMPRPSSHQQQAVPPQNLTPLTNSSDCSPLNWDKFFDRCESVAIPGTNDIFKVYIADPPTAEEGEEKQVSKQQDDDDDDTTTVVVPSVLPKHKSVIVLLHGGGHSAMSWALFTQQLRNKYRVCAMDLRAHGFTQTADESDLSAKVLTDDVVSVLSTLFPESSNNYSSNNNQGTDAAPYRFILIGHSLGGAIATRAATDPRLAKRVAGLIVIDVVEGTALASLDSMHSFLENRPSRFTSPEAAIHWSVKSGAIHNLESAKVSVPPQLKKIGDGKYIWRTNLAATEPFWKGWFTGLSELFLSARCAKLLLLANTDRLDKLLTIAHMQGKFQMAVITAVGHTVHEDAPERTAHYVKEFLERYRL